MLNQIKHIAYQILGATANLTQQEELVVMELSEVTVEFEGELSNEEVLEVVKKAEQLNALMEREGSAELGLSDESSVYLEKGYSVTAEELLLVMEGELTDYSVYAYPTVSQYLTR